MTASLTLLPCTFLKGCSTKLLPTYLYNTIVITRRKETTSGLEFNSHDGKFNDQKAISNINIDKPELFQNTVQCSGYNSIIEEKVAQAIYSFLQNKGIHFCDKCNKELVAAVCQCLEAEAKEQEIIQPIIECVNRTEMQNATTAALATKENLETMMAEVERRKNLLNIKKSIQPSAEKLKFKNYEYTYSDFVEASFKINTDPQRKHESPKKDYAEILDEEIDEQLIPSPQKEYDYPIRQKQPLAQKIAESANDTKADHRNIYHKKLSKMVADVESLKNIYFTRKNEKITKKKSSVQNPPNASFYFNKKLIDNFNFKKRKNTKIDFTQTANKEHNITLSKTEETKDQQLPNPKPSKIPEVLNDMRKEEMLPFGISSVPNTKSSLHPNDYFDQTQLGWHNEYQYNTQTPECAPKTDLQGSATKIRTNLKDPRFLPPLGPPPVVNPMVPTRLPPLPGCPKRPRPQGAPPSPKKCDSPKNPCKKFNPVPVVSCYKDENAEVKPSIRKQNEHLHNSFVRHILSVHCKNKDSSKPG